MLVVIAIIVILAAILFPVFGRARENARESSCASNLKQLGLGIMQYTQDNHELYLAPYLDINSNTVASQRFKWPELVQPYMKSRQILICPSDTNTNDIGDSYWGTSPHVSYGLNLGLQQGSGTTGRFGRALSAYQFPATTIAATDVGVTPVANTGPLTWTIEKPASWIVEHNPAVNTTGTSAHYAAPIPRHLEMSNTLWVDGHVKALRVEKFYNSAIVGTGGTMPCFNWVTGCG